MTYIVNIRTREIGIRMAIGADISKVIVMILTYGIKVTLLELISGLIASYFTENLLSQQLFQISAFDSIISALALMTLLLISILACLVPALKASSIPPMLALKSN